MLIAQITDTHISTPDGKPEQLYRTSEHLARAVTHINALPRQPDAVIATGDLVDAGTAEEYSRLRALLAPLAAPLYVLPGNHDDRAALRQAFGDHTYLPRDGFLQYTIEHLPVRVIALDTHLPGAVGGELCRIRLDWLAARLAEQRGRQTALFMHHPPFLTGIKRMDLWGLDNADALGKIVSANPQIERIVCGHLHRPVTVRWSGTVAVSCPSTAHQIGLDISGEAAKLAIVREPPACYLHLWSPEAGFVTHASYIGDFGPALNLDFDETMKA